MKVERKNNTFDPVIITLESQEEVDILHEMCGSVVGDGFVREITNDFYRKLQEHTLESGGYFDGNLDIVK